MAMTTIITNVTPITDPCYSCHQPVVQPDAQPVRLLVPSGRYHDGHAVLKASETVYECGSCQTAEFETSEQVSHIYTVLTCGTTRTVGAATPEEAAALMLKDRGWASTRSIAVIGAGVQCEFLDCELVNGSLQFSEQVQLP
jgi:hypothetical protein